MFEFVGFIDIDGFRFLVRRIDIFDLNDAVGFPIIGKADGVTRF